MIKNDTELKTSQQRITYFQDLLMQLCVKVTFEEFLYVSSGYRIEIEKMQKEVLDYLTQHSKDRIWWITETDFLIIVLVRGGTNEFLKLAWKWGMESLKITPPFLQMEWTVWSWGYRRHNVKIEKVEDEVGLSTALDIYVLLLKDYMNLLWMLHGREITPSVVHTCEYL